MKQLWLSSMFGLAAMASPAMVVASDRTVVGESSVADAAETADPETVFKNPPQTAKPGVWWHWMGCNVSKEGITRDLESFKDAGIGKATLFGMADVCIPWAAHIDNSPTDGLIAFTDPWWKLVRHAAAEGKRLGINVGMHNCPGYTHSGGPWIPPELSMLDVCFSKTDIQGGQKWSGTLPRPKVSAEGRTRQPAVNKDTGELEKPKAKGRTTFYRDIVVLALPAKGVVPKDKAINLSNRMNKDGKLEWTGPEGDWTVYRIGYTTMGSMTQPNQWEARGLECDKMSVEANEFHLNHLLGELQKHLGDLVGTGLKHMLFDSYEAGTPTWTPKMPEEFAKRRGYDLTPYMATFAGRTIESKDSTGKFKKDFNQTIKDLYRDVHFAVVSRMLKEANVEFVCEPYGGPFATAEVSPYVHRVMTEFWTDREIKVRKGIMNAGGGKVHNILEAEAFTGKPNVSQWTEHPGGLKSSCDGSFLSGVNRMILHHSVHQPFDDKYRPGGGMGMWGTHFGRLQTWWEPGKAWIAYLQRCQALLQWGEQVPSDFKAQQAKEIQVKARHRSSDKADVFFLVNRSDSAGSASCLFEKVSDRQPVLWDPTTGTMRDLREFTEEERGTRLTLKFEPQQSYFIVFRKEPSGSTNSLPNFLDFKPLKTVDGPWDVSFDPSWGPFDSASSSAKATADMPGSRPGEFVFDKLDDWTEREEPAIRYYSGTAVYRNVFDLPETSAFSNLRLDLGEFDHLAHVRINGRDLGVIWCKPHSVAIPAGLLERKGNQLEIEITNVWANRLIGDEEEPADCEWEKGYMRGGHYLKRFPDWFVKNEPRPSKGRYCFVTWNYFLDGKTALSPSGLRGPVRVMGVK